VPAPALIVAGAAARSRTLAPWLWWLTGCLACVTFVLVVGAFGALFGLQAPENGSYRRSAAARAEIPARYLRLYQQAGQRYRIDPWILAAIGSIETNHGRSTAAGVREGVNFAGCCAGPMQFNITNGPPSTWDGYGVDGNRDGRRSPYDLEDAIPAAAKYLRATGAPGDYRAAIFAYNHADWYVDEVLAKAAEYRAAPRLAELPDTSATVRKLLREPALVPSPAQRADLQAGGFDTRLLDTLAASTARHTIVITSMRADHSPGSNHEAGRAFDIGAVDGQICRGTTAGPCARLVRGFARSDHCDHIDVGWDA
jgi:hypothetical protein